MMPTNTLKRVRSIFQALPPAPPFFVTSLLSGVGRILDVKENACGDGLTGTGNSLVKSPRSRKKGGEARIYEDTSVRGFPALKKVSVLPRNIF